MMKLFHKFLELLRAIEEQATAAKQAVADLVQACKDLQDVLAQDIEAELEQRLQVITDDIKNTRQRLADSLKETN